MMALALSSLRRRASAFTATFLAVFLGTVILMAFAAMLDVAGSAAARRADDAVRDTLTIMATVVGGWGLLLVVFAVTSTLTLGVRLRADEIALLKSVGATPGQLGRMIVGESVAVSAVAALVAVGPGYAAGWALLELMHAVDRVPSDVGFVVGPFAPAIGVGVTLLSALFAGAITARRTLRGGVARAFSDARIDTGRVGPVRIVAAALFLAGAVSLSVVTVTVMGDTGTEAMATAGQADILAAVAFALVAPWLVRAAAALAGPFLRLCGASGELARVSLRRRAGRLGAVLAPVILFSGIGIGTLYLQQTENAALTDGGVPRADREAVELLNFVVIGMIVVFTAIMLINTLVAATAQRRREFGQYRLAGATPGQVRRATVLEAATLAVVGLAAGSAASLFTTVPFALARNDTPVPSGTPLTFAGVAVLAFLLTVVTARRAAGTALRVPAIAAVAP